MAFSASSVNSGASASEKEGASSTEGVSASFSCAETSNPKKMETVQLKTRLRGNVLP